ncbi:hypothetical protein RD1_3106 [Roseobacter denitrificans OCh 114]|uniref:Uncharacterized protein n=1 Tax=Roseobacter denitrificans (strain ATCC 33942 / OCh 114) TaxID=375451 RepID=Q164H8_ROSDO|nr:hypothetical protein RD1_3106 [Roseobacter denitrificans OCh 114]
MLRSLLMKAWAVDPAIEKTLPKKIFYRLIKF